MSCAKAAQSTMPSKQDRVTQEHDSLESFVKDVVGEDKLRVEEDLGQGFVRLKSSEAERRQAAQDIRCSEDIVLEMLRNARDAGARNIFLATGREGGMRTIVVVDDGSGIPEDMHARIFQPRVTSKLDSAKLDRWGIHGRGMALYSISENSEYSEVQRSVPGLGSSIEVRTDVSKLPERADQSTFPYFERNDSGYQMRGPKNILRTATEFAFEHRKALSVYCGTETEIVATLFEHGTKMVPASKRLFGGDMDDVPLTQALAASCDDHQLVQAASELGLDISARSARRILDGDIAPVVSLMQRIESESFPRAKGPAGGDSFPGEETVQPQGVASSSRAARISRDDLDAFELDLMDAFGALSEKYYLASERPRVRQRGSKLLVEFDIVENDS